MTETMVSTAIQVRQEPDLAQVLQKDRAAFTKRDLIGLAEKQGIGVLNFRFVAGDGRLKTFNFVLRGSRHLDRLLSAGERVDGSSLFATIDSGSSDLYIVPRYSTAYMNPFTPVPTLDVLCSFFDRDGKPLSSSPDNLVRSAHRALQEVTGCALETLAELEYYIISPPDSAYPGDAQRGYGESGPFAKWEALRQTAMVLLARMGFPVKYGHNEVGKATDERNILEQGEIEFDLAPPDQSADAIVVARWVLRTLAARAGVTVSFAPKLVHGHAGSGLHVHCRLVKDGINLVSSEEGLNDFGKRVVAGFLALAPSLTAFGNTVPVSYLRLVPEQEAPVYICWGERNRSTLVRIPLGWDGIDDMAQTANPQDPEAHSTGLRHHTIEFRCPDGSADVHLLHAGLAVAARHGLEMPDGLACAEKLRVNYNIFRDLDMVGRDSLRRLPSSCAESARMLLEQRAAYEKHGVFSAAVIDGVARRLMGFGDEEQRCRAGGFEELNKVIAKYLHCS
jgi:glutamine synthetase